VKRYSSLVLCGLLFTAAVANGAPQAPRHSTAKPSPVRTPPPVVVKLSATRELLTVSDHIGAAPDARGSAGMVVEMEPHPITVVVDTKRPLEGKGTR